MLTRQNPQVGRFLEENCALFFMPGCLYDDAGKIVYWNHHAARVCGLSAPYGPYAPGAPHEPDAPYGPHAAGATASAALLLDEAGLAPGEGTLDLFLAGRMAALEARYGKEHILVDAKGNLSIFDCRAQAENTGKNARKNNPAQNANAEDANAQNAHAEDARRLVLCGHWQDAESGKKFSYIGWTYLKDFEFNKSPSIDLYSMLRGLDRKRCAWFGIQQDDLYYYLSNEFVRALFPAGIEMPEIIGMPMSSAMSEAAAFDHARTIESIPLGVRNGEVFTWPHVFNFKRQAWVRSYPNVLTVNGRRANFSLVQDITAEKERDTILEDLLATYQSSADKQAAQGLLATFAGRSPAMRATMENLLRAALSLVTVAIYGETGTGKNLAARLIHLLSSRSDGPFVSVNCGAIPEELFESAFFGHVKGSFTGAVSDKEGFMTSADKGTLFLDEIAELPLRSQSKLLQALSEKNYTPVGSTKTINSKFRLIVATNRNLEDMVRQGLFREDLFYRVNVLDFTLPPLRERREDIPLLIENVLRRNDLDIHMPPEALRALAQHNWPGNVRELENVLLRYATDKNLDFFRADHSKRAGKTDHSGSQADSLKPFEGAGIPLKERLESCEREIILEALTRHRWNRNKTAQALGISRVSLFRKMKDYGLGG